MQSTNKWNAVVGIEYLFTGCPVSLFVILIIEDTELVYTQQFF